MMAASTIVFPLQSFLSSSSSSSWLCQRAFPVSSLGSGRRRARTWGPIRALVAEGTQEVLGTPSTPLPNDLSMRFKAEGTLADSAVSKVVKELEAIEGVSDVSVTIGEGIATVELSRQTNVQATSAASGLIETIQTQGFKLQNLSLVFDDDGNDDVYDYDYATSE